MIEDGIIKNIGTLDEVKTEGAELIIIDGKTLMPSFIDPHGHLSLTAQMSHLSNLSECETFEQVIDELNAHIKNMI